MSHSREIRTHGSEVKFLLATADAVRIRDWARRHLDPDPHGTGTFGDEYRTTSLYFDTVGFDVFHRRGSFSRSKYRIRRYGDADTVFLERKLRQPLVLAKRRTRTELATVSKLLGSDVDEAWDGAWFHRRVAARRLRPVCHLAYNRVARIVQRNGDVARLTLDTDLAAMPADGPYFVPRTEIPIADRRVILELKFRGAPPALFRQLVEEFALTPVAASKYRLGLASLGQVVHA